ncbi:hypothetical protein GGI09_000817 [Coemansia sp. S100]|nr:hypothetical protein LPJ71_000352 [Coemansia sp. S17]KAJ2103136.1 hypothetical protein GGI09_000817 [Coemansia sp. S100]KAJ2105406.1 hypothetical protein GGI16_002370 [Coemansia sp. S142-1]
MVCVICFDTLFPTAVEDDSHAANTPAEPSRIAALGCGHTFHLECIKSWETRMAAIACPMCNVPQVGTIIPLFIEYDGDRDTNRQTSGLEQYDEYNEDAYIYTEYQNKYRKDVNSCLATRCKELMELVTALQVVADEKTESLDERQATIDELTERVEHLESRERELMALLRRHKLRMRRLQIMNKILDRNVARMEEAPSDNDVVLVPQATVFL